MSYQNYNKFEAKKWNMKRSLLSFFIIVLIFFGCNKEDRDPTPSNENEDELVIPDFPDFVFDNNRSIDISDSISITFSWLFKGFNTKYVIDGEVWIPKLNYLKLTGSDEYDFDSLFVKNTLKIWRSELFTSNEEISVELSYDWTHESGLFKTAEHQFIVSINQSNFPFDLIKAWYPVDRQYYFLKNEYNKGFFTMERVYPITDGLLLSIKSADGVEIANPALVVNSSKNRIEFDLPDLDNEKVYYLEFFNYDNLIKTIHFRTSKYNTFNEKVSNLSLGETSREILFLWEGLFLRQLATIEMEGFDLAEASFASEDGYSAVHRYCTGLVQLEFVTEGNFWFEDFAYPIVYEPFSDSNFEPGYRLHPNLGSYCQFAMQFRFPEDLHSLTNEEIASGITNQSFHQSFSVYNLVMPSVYFDFINVKANASSYYAGHPTKPNRVQRLLDSSFNLPTTGSYNYKINYRLPDGTITTSVNQEMNLMLE